MLAQASHFLLLTGTLAAALLSLFKSGAATQEPPSKSCHAVWSLALFAFVNLSECRKGDMKDSLCMTSFRVIGSEV